MSPEYVRPYVKAQKNDDRDAEAIAEAATRPTMRFVALKSEAQLDMQTLHRVRDRLVGERTALINQLRGILLERGIMVPQGRRKLLERIAGAVGRRRMRSASSPRMRLLLDGHARPSGTRSTGASRRSTTSSPRWRATTRRTRRLATIPGIGVLNATALVAAIGDGEHLRRGRDLAAWLGLVPRQSDHRRQAEAARDHQARQQIPAQAADPRRPGGAAVARPNARRRSAAGCAACWRGRTATPSSWRWRASWRGSSGRCCAPRPRFAAREPRRHRTRSAARRSPDVAAVRGLRVVEARWPDSRPASRQPTAQNGTRRRPLYEDRDARISILARVRP